MLPGTFTARRRAAHATSGLLAGLTAFQGAAVLALGAPRPGVGVTLALLAVMAFVNGRRSTVASALGMDAAPEQVLELWEDAADRQNLGRPSRCPPCWTGPPSSRA